MISNNLFLNEKINLPFFFNFFFWFKSVLLTLKSILDNKPLIHEPGITEKHREFNTYNDIVKYRTIEVAIGKILTKNIYSDICDKFWDEIISNFINNYDKILASIPVNNKITDIKTNIYNLSAKINYKHCIDVLSKIYQLNKK